MGNKIKDYVQYPVILSVTICHKTRQPDIGIILDNLVKEIKSQVVYISVTNKTKHMINYTNINENINIYFKEIRKFSSLTRKDEMILFTQISNGDKMAETEVFNKMSKLAVNIAKTYTCNPELLEDLIQEANMGILTAIKKYDMDAGYRFSSYARWWMKAYIGKFLEEMGIVHHCNPVIIKKANKIREQFYMENHREISEYELMDKLEEIGEIVNDISTILNITSVRIDMPVSEDDVITKKDMGVFADRTASTNSFVEEEENETLSSDIAKRLAKLTPREQQLILMKFGFVSGYEMDYKSIAEKWNEGKSEKEQLTQERVRQLVIGALKKMK